MDGKTKIVVIDGVVPKEYMVPDYSRIKKFLESLDKDDHCAWAHLEEGETLDGE